MPFPIAGKKILQNIDFATLAPPITDNWFCVLPLERLDSGMIVEKDFSVGPLREKAQITNAPFYPNTNATTLSQKYAEFMVLEDKNRKLNNMGRTSLITKDESLQKYCYRQRTKMGFPDYITIRFLNTVDGGSTFALYSRSKIGNGDLGVNKKRITRWLEQFNALMTSGGNVEPTINVEPLTHTESTISSETIQAEQNTVGAEQTTIEKVEVEV
ncbi:hypothetical protein AKO1_011613 [Acrasis kona]|uniref:DUF1499 domain-containing protein n=1 Tax=Acrasis kona TaxID=1008807 RepID=A0AAW2Z784_9EUKA